MKNRIPLTSWALALAPSSLDFGTVIAHIDKLAGEVATSPGQWKANLPLARAQMVADLEIQQAEALLRLAEMAQAPDQGSETHQAESARLNEIVESAGCLIRIGMIMARVVESAVKLGEFTDGRKRIGIEIFELQEMIQAAEGYAAKTSEPRENVMIETQALAARLKAVCDEHNSAVGLLADIAAALLQTLETAHVEIQGIVCCHELRQKARRLQDGTAM